MDLDKKKTGISRGLISIIVYNLVWLDEFKQTAMRSSSFIIWCLYSICQTVANNHNEHSPKEY